MIFVFQHSLPQCIVKRWFNHRHLRDFRILPGTGLNPGTCGSADSNAKDQQEFWGRELGWRRYGFYVSIDPFLPWLVIFFSEFNLPLKKKNPPSIVTMFPKHTLSSRPSWCIWSMRYARKVYLPLVRDGCWGKDGLWFRTSIPTCSMEFPWSEHKGALGSPMVYPHSFQAGDTPHTQTPNTMSFKILQVGWEHVWEIPIQTH